jgi:hypothetical protein
MEYEFEFQFKGGDPCKLTVEAESYDAAFQKICALPGEFRIWRKRGYIELIPYPETLTEVFNGFHMYIEQAKEIERLKVDTDNTIDLLSERLGDWKSRREITLKEKP